MCSAIQYWPLKSLKLFRNKSCHCNSVSSGGNYFLTSPDSGNIGKIFMASGVRRFSSAELFTALKPFFFQIHPDLFGQYPKEREVNENSLKHLNAYIENSELQRQQVPTNLTFYLRKGRGGYEKEITYKENISQQVSSGKEVFKTIRVDLGQSSSKSSKYKTVHSILEKCNLSTSHLETLPKSDKSPKRWNLINEHYSDVEEDSEQEVSFKDIFNKRGPSENIEYEFRNQFWKDLHSEAQQAKRNIENEKANQDNLEIWLKKNSEAARKKLQLCWPNREETLRLREDLCKNLEIKDIIWKCGWSPKHFKGCLESLRSLSTQHPEHIKNLKGRTVVFGGETGVSFEGYVILSSGEVRANWLDLIKHANKHDALILRIPFLEKALSRALKDIKVVHRKFQPTRIISDYEFSIRKLTTSIGDWRCKNSYPKALPENLSHLELVVESCAGPLMLSPTGQIIVPSSCPPFLLFNFIVDHLAEASQKLSQYTKQKYEERDLHDRCIKELNLVALEKDDSINPSMNIAAMSRLLQQTSDFSQLLHGTHLFITNYYSVLSEGEICIPWDFKC